jgi:hypothetical protein
MEIIGRLPSGKIIWQSKDAEGRTVYFISTGNYEPNTSQPFYSKKEALIQAKSGSL